MEKSSFKQFKVFLQILTAELLHLLTNKFPRLLDFCDEWIKKTNIS